MNFLEGENKEDGALLGQAQVKLEIKVEVGVQVEVSHDCPSGRVGGGLWTKTRLILYLSGVEHVL